MTWAGSLAYANTSDSVAHAAQVEPGNATYHGLLAEHQEAGSKDPKPELTIATRLSPRESRYWARLAFRAEVEGNFDAALKHLTQAANVDRTFAPRWALANFYLRRGQTEQIWVWIGKSLKMAPPDPESVFQLAWSVSQDGAKIRGLLPPGRDLLRRYVGWLVENQPAGVAKGPAMELAEKSTAEDLSVLLGFCNKAAAIDPAGMLAMWNALCSRNLMPCTALPPDQSQLVTDSSFQEAGTGTGLSWGFANQPGASVIRAGNREGVTAELRGRQAERLVLLWQRVPLLGMHRYRLSYEYRMDGGRGKAGLHWEISEFKQDRNLIPDAPRLASVEWREEQVEFDSREDTVGQLRFVYQREPGSLPWQGTVHLRNVRIGKVQ